MHFCDLNENKNIIQSLIVCKRFQYAVYVLYDHCFSFGHDLSSFVGVALKCWILLLMLLNNIFIPALVIGGFLFSSQCFSCVLFLASFGLF